MPEKNSVGLSAARSLAEVVLDLWSKQQYEDLGADAAERQSGLDCS